MADASLSLPESTMTHRGYRLIGMITLASASLLSLFVSSCQSKQSSPQEGGAPKAAALKVQAYIVESKVLDDNFNVSGSIIASEQTDLHPEISGRITALPMKEGSVVKAGDLLLKLYDADLQAQLKKLNVQLEIARKAEQRSKELLAVKGASQQDYDLAMLQSSNIAADIDVLKANISKTEIRAPFGGRIGLRTVSIGAYVNPSTIVASIREVGSLKLDFDVPERYSSLMKQGNTVSFSVSGSPQNYTARILATETQVNEQSRTLAVRCLVQGAHENLVPGAFANVQVSLASRPSALMIPTQALIPQARDKKVIVVKNGKASFVSVTTGFRSNSSVEITKGLQEHDTVVTTGLLFLKPESKVDIASFVK